MINHSSQFINTGAFSKKVESAIRFFALAHDTNSMNGINGVLRMFAPELFDKPFCESLGQELILEIRENYHRFTESKSQDRYSNSIFTLLKPLDSIFLFVYKLKTFSLYDEEKFVDNNGKYITEKEMPDAKAIIEVLQNLNKIRLPVQDELKNYAPEQFQNYKNKIDSYAQGETSNQENKVFPSPSNKTDKAERETKLQWKGDKTDLAELVRALAKSGRVTDTSTGNDATQKELSEQIATLLGLDSLDIASLMKGRYGTKTKPTSYKAQDGKTFVNELQKLLDKRVID